MGEATGESQAFLSTLSASRRELWVIRVACALLLVAGAALAPFAPIPLGEVWPFIPAYEAALSISDLITGVMLLCQVPVLKSRALLVLGCGYGFAALVEIPHMLSFPGLFAPTGLLGAGPQTTAWLYLIWHAGLPLAIVAYALLKDARGNRADLARPSRAIPLAIVGTIALALGLTLVTTWGQSWLPAVMVGHVKSATNLLPFEAVWALSIVALLALLARRPYSLLDLWLMVVSSALICDGALSSVFNVGRFDLGFYAGRAFGFVASNLVLIALLIGTSALYGRASRLLQLESAAKNRLDTYSQSLERRVEASDARLRQSAEHLARAQKVGMLGSAELNLRTGELHWSDQIYALLGLDPASTTPSVEAFLGVVAPEFREQQQNLIARVRQREAVQPVDFRIVRPDGAERWLHRSTEFVRDETGTPTLAINTFQDITERKRFEDELGETRTFLDQVIDNLPGTLVVKDAKDLRYRLWNKGSEELMGIGREEVIGKTDRDLVPPEQAELFAAGDRATFAAGKMQFIPEERVTTRARGTRIIQIKKVPVFDETGVPSYLLAFADDITEFKLAEQARDRAEAATIAKSSFLANMSHEIRTPMNAVIGLSDLVLRTDLDARQQDYLVKIKASAMALLGIINDILDFSKIEAGKLQLDNVDFDLRRVLDGIANVSALRATEKGVELLFSIDPAVPTMVVGDSLRLGQVLQNLVSNAIKFTERGEIVVEIKLAGRAAGAVRLDFTVTDSGIGMDEAIVARLFQPFTQADNSTTRRFGGTGLGLTISQQLVEMMGGRITVTSWPGQGSRFAFTIALGESQKAEEGTRLLVSAFAGLRALVIDDSAASRHIFEAILTHWGMTVDTAASGPSGIAAFRAKSQEHRPYDLLLVDWHMPGLDGIETVEAIRAEPAPSKAPAVILVTAYGRDDLIHRAGDLRVDAFLAKPISDSTLLDTVSTALAGEVERAPQRRARTIAIERVAPPGARILLVDDNDINRQVGEETLTSAGFVVEMAEDGRIAVDKILDPANHYDVVLMDLQMPVLDGLEATRLVRATIPSSRLPIIALTASAMTEERQRCIDAGMDDHAAKPIEPASLVATVMRWIKPAVARAEAAPASMAGVESAGPGATPPDDLPVTLPPFDIAAALVRVNGKRPLLRRLIVSFGKEFRHSVPQLRRMLSDGNFKDAERIAHTLKSTAATLGADALSSAAAALEHELRSGNRTALEPLLTSLDSRLLGALDAAATLGGD